MAETYTINMGGMPLSCDELAEQFATCGVAAGQTVVLHSSLSKLGYVVGGAETVIRALLRVLTPEGTLMVPTMTIDNTEPSLWTEPPVPESWWPIIREHTPVYDPQLSYTREMGRIPEMLRIWPGALRSGHPIASFAAVGKQAAYLTESHPLEDEFGDESPIGKLYAMDGYVLLLGVGHGNNSSLHRAERLANWPGKHTVRDGCAMLVNGKREWVYFERGDLDAHDFAEIGRLYEKEHGIPIHKVGLAEAHFMRQRPLVDFAVEWMERNRK